MKDQLYRELLERMNEAAIIPPQKSGIFTPHYRFLSGIFKQHSWQLVVVLSLGLTVLFYLFLGTYITRVVSLIQFGF
jgi:hypothetical protein